MEVFEICMLAVLAALLAVKGTGVLALRRASRAVEKLARIQAGLLRTCREGREIRDMGAAAIDPMATAGAQRGPAEDRESVMSAAMQEGIENLMRYAAGATAGLAGLAGRGVSGYEG